jgi:hypothetical protein
MSDIIASTTRRKNFSFYVSEHYKDVSTLIEEFVATSPRQFSDLICYCIRNKAKEVMYMYEDQQRDELAGE